MAVTVRDIAEHLSLSVATVTQSLAGTGRISGDTRQRVRAAAARLGYRPHSTARALKEQRTRTIAVLIHDPQPAAPGERQRLAPHPYEFLIGIDEILAEHGYATALVRMTQLERTPTSASRLLQELAIDGAIVQVALVDAAVRSLLAGVSHLVWLDCGRRDATACVWRDEEAAGQRAAELVMAAGVRRVLFVEPDRPRPGYDHATRRFAGVERAARARGVAVRWVDAPPADCAGIGVVAGDYRVGQRLAAQLRPGVPLVACDDISTLADACPGLTAVPYDRIAAGRSAALLLLRRIAGEPVPSEVVRVASATPP